MGNEWKTLQLKEVGITLIDCVHKTPPDAGTGIPYIAIPQMKEGRIAFSANPRLISNEHYVEWTKKAKPQHNDIILSRRCNPGETSYVPAGVKFALGQNLVLLRSDGSKVQPSFLRWLVRGSDWWGQVGKFINIGAVFESLKCAEIPKFELPIPPLPEQKAIAHVLGTLDDRIELNRRVNGTLESMAQALFKSWFVDFDPVIDNAQTSGKEIPAELSKRAAARAALGDKRQPLPAEIRTLFPAQFTDSAELGWIPKGWEVKSLGQITEKITDGTHSTVKDNPQGDYYLLSCKNIKEGQILIGESERRIDKNTLDSLRKRTNLSQYDVLLTTVGTIGEVAMIRSADIPYEFQRSVAILRADLENCLPEFLYQLVKSGRFIHEAEARSEGSVQQCLFLGAIKSIIVNTPSIGLLRVFNEQVKALYDKVENNRRENELLASSRNALLPKLLSGEVRIPDAEKMVEELAL